MVITIRLYWQQDPDLIALFKNPSFDFNGAMKKTILAYASGSPFTISLPPPVSLEDEMMLIDDCVVTHVYLNEAKDKDAIDAIHTFRYGYINSALKILFRSYLENPFLDPLYTESNYQVKTRVRGKRVRNGESSPAGGKIIHRPAWKKPVSAAAVKVPEAREVRRNAGGFPAAEKNSESTVKEHPSFKGRTTEDKRKDMPQISRQSSGKDKNSGQHNSQDRRRYAAERTGKKAGGNSVFDLIDGADWF